MAYRTLFLCLAFLLSLFVGCSQSEDKITIDPPPLSVVQLVDANFTSYVQSEANVIVMFYAHWCHWSQKTLPSFYDASKLMTHHEPAVRFATIDSSLHGDVQDEHNIMHYPTFKLFIDGKPHAYTGGRYHTQIVTWISEFLNTEKSIDSLAELETVMSVHKKEIIVIGHLINSNERVLSSEGIKHLSGTDEIATTFMGISREWPEYFYFIDINSDEVLNHLISTYNITSEQNEKPFILMLNSIGSSENNTKRQMQLGNFNADESYSHVFDGDMSNQEAIEKFLYEHQFPALVPFEVDYIERIFSVHIPILILFLRRNDNNAAVLQAAYDVGKTYKSSLICIVSYSETHPELQLERLSAADKSPSPKMRIFAVRSKGGQYISKMRMLPSDAGITDVSPDSIRLFAKKFHSGLLSPHIESEDVYDEDLNNGPVRVVVAKNFDREVRSLQFDSFVLFYAPWCGHCRKLEPTWTLMAAKFKLVKTVKVFKIDATINEVLDVTITGFPTMAFFGAGKKTIQYYHGKRKANTMIEWIAERVTHKFDTAKVVNQRITLDESENLVDIIPDIEEFEEVLDEDL